MNADEAKREAVRILANRLKAWDVDEALKKAQMFMDDVRLAGWVWMPPANRPMPPKAEVACRTCGKEVGQCPCPAPKLHSAPVDHEAYERGAALARQLLHPTDAAACRGALHHPDAHDGNDERTET